MPKKPVRFLLEFTGTQPVRVDGEGAFIRPPTAAEICQGICDEINHRLSQAGGIRFKVTVKRLD